MEQNPIFNFEHLNGMPQKQKYNFGDPNRRSVNVERVTKEKKLGEGSYKTVYGTKVEGDNREFVLSEFKDNFDAEDSTLEYKFAYKLAKNYIASVPIYIQIGNDATRFLPTERVLADNIKLSNGAKFLTLKLICGNNMISYVGGYPGFFIRLRELYSELIDITNTIYMDSKVDNVCCDQTTGRIKIVDVDKQYFAELTKYMIETQKEQWLDYMIFQTWVVEFIKYGKSVITLADAGLDEDRVIKMFEVLICTQHYFEKMPQNPIINLCWYSRRNFNIKDLVVVFKHIFYQNPRGMLNFIYNGDANILFNGVKGGRRRRRTMHRKSLRNKKSRKNRKK